MEGSTEGLCSGSPAVLATGCSRRWGGPIPPCTFYRCVFRLPCDADLEKPVGRDRIVINVCDFERYMASRAYGAAGQGPTLISSWRIRRTLVGASCGRKGQLNEGNRRLTARGGCPHRRNAQD
ncbi:hypothetical protein GCM10011428_39700 [Streptomyces violaceus]